MDDWDKLDQQFNGGKSAAAPVDAWAALDASFAKPQAAAPTVPTVQAVAAPSKPTGTQTRMDRILQGMRDPIDGGAQLLTHMLPKGLVDAGNSANNWLADKTGLVARIPEGGVDQQIKEREAAYQEAHRASQPATLSSLITGQKEDPGFDGYRMLGNVASPVNIAAASRLPQLASLGGRVALGAGYGAGSAALAPVVEGDFPSEKLKQIGTGAAFGGAMPVATGALSRVISPKASTNSSLQMLKKEGVNPTIGQALGGRLNALEEKLTSVPILGDAISSARGRALSQFNKAAINRATVPVGQKVDSIGQKGVMDAGNKVSGAYDDALTSLGPVQFDSQFSQQAGQLQGMANNLLPAMRDKFNKTYQQVVVGRMSPNGTMLPEAFKKVDSELEVIASRYGKSSVASEQEAGDAIKQLRTILKEQAARSDPAAAAKLAKADAGWANLVRVEGAAKSAKNNDGVFTPAQLNMAAQTADQSVRKRAVSRGTALMQDLGNAGQGVLGNRVPNSFTTDRALIAGGGLGAYLINPAIPAGLLGGAAMYTAPAQKLLVGAASSRPKAAKAVAEALDKRAAMALPLSVQLGLGLLN